MSGAWFLLIAGWALWLRGWLSRTELRALAAAQVEAARLHWEPDGWRGAVFASGMLDGRSLRMRWQQRWGRVRASVWLESSGVRRGGWAEVPMEGGMLAVRALRAERG